MKKFVVFRLTFVKNLSLDLLKSYLKQPLAKTFCEKDLGIFIKHDLKWDVQVRHSTAKANRMLGMIRKSFKFLD